jgi:hypothetical protein
VRGALEHGDWQPGEGNYNYYIQLEGTTARFCIRGITATQGAMASHKGFLAVPATALRSILYCFFFVRLFFINKTFCIKYCMYFF